MASLCCHGDSDCNKTQIIRNFHLYIKQLWKPFFHIFTHCAVVNAQTWEGTPPKNSNRATLKCYRYGHRSETTLSGLLDQWFKVIVETPLL